MFALFARSYKLTPSGPARLYPLYRPCLQTSAVGALTQFYSNEGVDRLDEATLKNFKRVLSLRQKLERCGALEYLKGGANKSVVEKPWQASRLVISYQKLLQEMCNTEYRKQVGQIPPEAPGLAKALHRCDLAWGPSSYVELLPVTSRLEKLLEADAAQQQPLLNSHERGTLADVLKEYVRWRRRERRQAGVVLLVILPAWIWIYWPENSSSNGSGEGDTVTEKKLPRREGNFAETAHPV